MKKRVITAFAACVAMSLCSITASAVDGLRLKLDEVGEASGYYIRGYYGSNQSNAVEVKPSIDKDGNYFFAGQSGNSNYSVFFFEIYNSDDELVKSKTVGYIGDLEYADDTVMDVVAPVTYEDIEAYNLKMSGLDVTDNKKPITTESSETDKSDNTENTGNTENTEGNGSVSNTESVADKLSAGVVLRVTSDTDISVIQATNGFILNLTDNDTTTFNVLGLAPEFLLTDKMEQGTYAVDCEKVSKAYSEVSVDESITVDSSKVTFLNVFVTPSCTLEVKKSTKSGNLEAEYTVEGINKTFNTRNGCIAVCPGSSYTVTDKDTGNRFDITIPTTAKRCVLDLSTDTGVPVNDKAYEEAELGTTASEDNPFNIPPTGDATVPDGRGIFTILGLSLVAFIARYKTNKKERND